MSMVAYKCAKRIFVIFLASFENVSSVNGVNPRSREITSHFLSWKGSLGRFFEFYFSFLFFFFFFLFVLVALSYLSSSHKMLQQYSALLTGIRLEYVMANDFLLQTLHISRERGNLSYLVAMYY